MGKDIERDLKGGRNLDKKVILGLGISVLFNIILIVYTVQKQNENRTAAVDNSLQILQQSENTNLKSSEQEKEEKSIKMLQVYVCGAVKKPAVISVENGSRIQDAVERVGGFLPTANLNEINLAAFIQDGDKIYIPKQGEISYENSVLNNQAAALNQKKKININRANSSELDQLPGIGPSLAESIIQYREQKGAFSSIEDIKNVPRIGDKKYEQLQDYISIQ